MKHPRLADRESPPAGAFRHVFSSISLHSEPFSRPLTRLSGATMGTFQARIPRPASRIKRHPTVAAGGGWWRPAAPDSGGAAVNDPESRRLPAGF